MPLTVGACTYSWLWDLPLQETIQLAHDIGAAIVVAVAGKEHALIAPDRTYLWGLVRGALESLLRDCERLDLTFGLENG